MGKNKKPKKPKKQQKKSGIVVPELRDKEPEMLFSFKYLDTDGNSKFAIEKCDQNHLSNLLARLRDLSKLKCMEFRTDRSKSLRSHRIEWEDTTEPRGFQLLDQQLRDLEPYQFSISQQERVHGFLLDDVFYVVWLDPNHELYAWKAA